MSVTQQGRVLVTLKHALSFIITITQLFPFYRRKIDSKFIQWSRIGSNFSILFFSPPEIIKWIVCI